MSRPSRKEHQEKNWKNGKQPESELKRTSGRCLQTVLPGCWSLCLTIYVSIVVGPSVHIYLYVCTNPWKSCVSVRYQLWVIEVGLLDLSCLMFSRATPHNSHTRIYMCMWSPRNTTNTVHNHLYIYCVYMNIYIFIYPNLKLHKITRYKDTCCWSLYKKPFECIPNYLCHDTSWLMMGHGTWQQSAKLHKNPNCPCRLLESLRDP